MHDAQTMLLKTNLKQLRLPTVSAEFEKLAREAAEADERYETYLLRLTELEVASRQSNALQARIKAAGFPVEKDFDTFDFTAIPALSKPKILELARGEWIEERANCCFVGSVGVGNNAPRHRARFGRLPAGQAGALLHRGQSGHAAGGGTEAVPARSLPGPVGQD